MSRAAPKPKILQFSEPFLKVTCFDDVEDLRIDNKTIVLNASDAEVVIEGNTLPPWKSSVFASVVIPAAVRIICVTLDIDFFSGSAFPHASSLKESWTPARDIFSNLKNMKLWRSAKDRIDNIEFNLWYAAAGTNCGIHNEHNFRELHTQIFGLGRMQKFYGNNRNSLYQEVYMSPGYTHYPFYDKDGKYPWHQYSADTDCIWLATELHGQRQSRIP
jgi:hypothetical protein